MILFTSIVALIFVFVRRYLKTWIHKDNSPLLPSIIAVTSANYSFLLGFSVIVLWQAYNHAQLITTSEANRLALILYDSTALPQPMRGEIEKAVKDYVKEVREKEWPAMAAGNFVPEALEPIKLLFHAVQEHPPHTESERIFYREVVSNINHVVEKRVERLNSTDSILTGPLRFLLIAGIFIIGFLMSLMPSKSIKLHFLSVITVSAVISFNVGIALTLDYPFSGDVSVSNEPFIEGILERFRPADETREDFFLP